MTTSPSPSEHRTWVATGHSDAVLPIDLDVTDHRGALAGRGEMAHV